MLTSACIPRYARFYGPQALYIFSADDAEVQHIVASSRSGGVCTATSTSFWTIAHAFISQP